ncbi:hypothetical protein DERF_009830 [Dermatophagoides farinae]|uniref:Uncharacterized protein n=1 Tax=Dermatophagoides farinae TaxID=6954 RepID=A0A922HYS3_DERFA|nr:hypothetical protein DERF_009830 [Dermatophagoides farinae]
MPLKQFVQLRSRSRFQRNAFCAHFAADFASNRWCSPSIEHRKKHLRFNVECLHAMNPQGYPIESIDTNLD